MRKSRSFHCNLQAKTLLALVVLVELKFTFLIFLKICKWCYCCLSNRKFERSGGPLDEIVTVSVHKYNVIISRPNMTSWHHLIREMGCQDVGCFILNEFLTNHSQLNDTCVSLIGYEAITTLEMFTNIEFLSNFYKFISAQQVRSLYLDGCQYLQQGTVTYTAIMLQPAISRFAHYDIFVLYIYGMNIHSMPQAIRSLILFSSQWVKSISFVRDFLPQPSAHQ